MAPFLRILKLPSRDADSTSSSLKGELWTQLLVASRLAIICLSFIVVFVAENLSRTDVFGVVLMPIRPLDRTHTDTSICI